MSGSSPTTLGLGKGRLESLTDGIFATVMTVLILSLSIPTIINNPSNPSLVNQEVLSYVLTLGPIVLSYVLSFLLLAVFWVRHHNMFHFVSRVDNTLIWINIAFLLTVGFVPFTTELLGRFWDTQVAAVIYGANLIATGLAMQSIWVYASKRRLLSISAAVDEKVMGRINARLTVGPALYALAILIALTVPSGPVIAVAIYVIVLVFYVFASSLGGGEAGRLLSGSRRKEKP